MKKVVLGFSGGLDTTYCVKWLQENGYEPVCVTLDIGQEADINKVRTRAAGLGVKDIRIIDGLDAYADFFLLPALKANALYQGVYPLATALSRPYIGKVLADVAKELGTDHIAHGCTGKGNDQVRIELAIHSLMDRAVIIDPIRDNNLSRDEEIRWLASKGIVIEITNEKPYSIDQNIWGRSVCAGILEEIDVLPPEEVFDWTAPIGKTPDHPADIEIGFKAGTPVSLNAKPMKWREIIRELNALAGKHGIGRIDHIEDRVVGIKSREIYEAPAAITLIRAHQALESITLARAALNFKKSVDQEYANLIYQGYWFSNHHMDLVAYIQHNQKHVTGTIGLRLFKGNIIVTKRESQFSLYNQKLATYTGESLFDQTTARGFISIYGMENRILARKQLFNFSEETRLLDDDTKGGPLSQG